MEIMVGLIRAQLIQGTPVGWYNGARFDIKANPIIKEVFIHFDYGKEERAHWVRPLSDGFDHWSCTTPYPAGKTSFFIRFCIRGVGGGDIYWDNNGGWDYCLIRDHENLAIGEGECVLAGAVAEWPTRSKIDDHGCSLPPEDRQELRGWIATRIQGNKEINVVYTQDCWKTFKEQPVTNRFEVEYGIEWWHFSVNPQSGGEYIDFAIRCMAYRSEHWDNNFGRNYRVPVFNRAGYYRISPATDEH